MRCIDDGMSLEMVVGVSKRNGKGGFGFCVFTSVLECPSADSKLVPAILRCLYLLLLVVMGLDDTHRLETLKSMLLS